MQDFHGRYYHPSNARFWFYGDDPADERLSLLSKYLDEFEARPVDSTVHAQPLKQVMLDHAHCAVCHSLSACLCAVLLCADLLTGFAGRIQPTNSQLLQLLSYLQPLLCSNSQDKL
jgi:secreted Zn-dependent insulinase-like peptidase